jgi:SNW domain-containing protein 1
LVASTHSALVPKLEKLNSEMPKPDDEEAQKTAKETADALAKALIKKRSAVDPQAIPGQPGAAEYIKYQPSNPQGTTRIIKMQEAQVDPLEPPKFRHIKVVSTSGDAPVPIMHSPPRKSTAQDQQDWIIPPCISNWKNAKGYTIPLDKRLAADGRGLQEVQINNSFAKFSEALYIAEQKARAAVEARGKMQRELLAREKEHKEAELRDLAMKARMDRLGVGGGGMGERVEEAGGGGGGQGGGPSASGAAPLRHQHEIESGGISEEDDMPRRREKSRRRSMSTDAAESSEEEEEREDEPREEREERRRREEIRKDRRRERERERRLESKEAHGYKRSKVTRDRERDISERVALGMAKVAGGGEAMYDQRLFNQDVGGAGAGGVGGNDEAYNIYDKPLFTDRSELFKATAGGGSKRDVDEADLPGGGGDIDTKRFKPDKGFAGAEYGRGGGGGGGGGEGGGVVFEQDAAGEAADPFGLGTFLSDVKGGKKKGGALDGIGKSGGMAAAGGGGGGGGSGRRREFVSGSDK